MTTSACLIAIREKEMGWLRRAIQAVRAHAGVVRFSETVFSLLAV